MQSVGKGVDTSIQKQGCQIGLCQKETVDVMVDNLFGQTTCGDMEDAGIIMIIHLCCLIIYCIIKTFILLLSALRSIYNVSVHNIQERNIEITEPKQIIWFSCFTSHYGHMFH